MGPTFTKTTWLAKKTILILITLYMRYVITYKLLNMYKLQNNGLEYPLNTGKISKINKVMCRSVGGTLYGNCRSVVNTLYRKHRSVGGTLYRHCRSLTGSLHSNCR